ACVHPPASQCPLSSPTPLAPEERAASKHSAEWVGPGGHRAIQAIHQPPLGLRLALPRSFPPRNTTTKPRRKGLEWRPSTGDGHCSFSLCFIAACCLANFITGARRGSEGPWESENTLVHYSELSDLETDFACQAGDRPGRRFFCTAACPQAVDWPPLIAGPDNSALFGQTSATAFGEGQTPSQKREERLLKFRDLHLKRNEARKLNHQEVVEEDKRLKLPANWEAKKARLEWEVAEDAKKKECADKGEDYHRVKLLEITADDAERFERKKKKKNPDQGFAGYAEAQFRQYQRLTKQIRPDFEGYEKQREECGVDFHPTSNSLIHGTHIPSKEGIDRMVDDVEKQIEKRAKYSRRRAYNDDADIDYINERNAKFNKKAERFYGKYTAEIKQNLERGTAV
ncbi:Pre-mRNA-splicing factor syf2, partial [Dissostichus eleginoides]